MTQQVDAATVERWVGHSPPMVQDTTFTAKLPQGLKDAINAEAGRRGVSASRWAREAFVAKLGYKVAEGADDE